MRGVLRPYVAAPRERANPPEADRWAFFSSLLEDEYHAILQGLRRVETLLTDEKGKREILERNLEELKRHIAALQMRIETMEQRLHG